MPRTSLVAAALTLSVCLANAPVVSAASAPTQAWMVETPASMARQTVVHKIRTLLTTYLTDPQLSKILDAMAEDIYANKTFSESLDTLIDPGDLTLSQMAILTKVAGGLQSDLGAASGVPLAKARAVLLHRFESYYMDMSAKVLAMRSGKRTKADCFHQVYVMMAKSITKANIAAALSEFKGSLTAKEWEFVRAHGAALVLWSGYGL